MKPTIQLKTPLGVGTFQGWMPVLQNGVKINKAIVRLPINAQTEPHKRDANCLTKSAVGSGLWLFAQGDIKAEAS
jgi:hypothetical protein